jgi:hypothetical protein
MIYIVIYIIGFALVLGIFGIPLLIEVHQKDGPSDGPIDPSVWIALPIIAFIWPLIASAFLALATIALLLWLADL